MTTFTTLTCVHSYCDNSLSENYSPYCVNATVTVPVDILGEGRRLSLGL